MIAFLLLFSTKLLSISCRISINWSEEKPHNNYISIGGATNLFFCKPVQSENCSRVLQLKIADTNSFACQQKVIMKYL